MTSCPEGQCSPAIDNGVHRVQAVNAEVHQNLLNLNPVRQYWWQSGFQIDLQVHPPLPCLAANETQYLPDDFVDVEGGLFQGSGFEKCSHPPHDISRMVTAVKNILNKQARIFDGSGTGRERVETHMCVGDDRC